MCFNYLCYWAENIFDCRRSGILDHFGEKGPSVTNCKFNWRIVNPTCYNCNYSRKATDCTSICREIVIIVKKSYLSAHSDLSIS